MLNILKIEHTLADNTVVYTQENIPNILHNTGEQFLLGSLFATATSGFGVPMNYFFGLDNRTNLTVNDTMASITGEPNGNGYQRATANSMNGFSITLQSSHYQATTAVLTWTASGGNFPQIRNVFMTNLSSNLGYLISSIALSSPQTVLSGSNLSVTFALNLKDC